LRRRATRGTVRRVRRGALARSLEDYY